MQRCCCEIISRCKAYVITKFRNNRKWYWYSILIDIDTLTTVIVIDWLIDIDTRINYYFTKEKLLLLVIQSATRIKSLNKKLALSEEESIRGVV